MAQTEFERGFIAGMHAMRQAAATNVLQTYIQIPKEDKAT